MLHALLHSNTAVFQLDFVHAGNGSALFALPVAAKAGLPEVIAHCSVRGSKVVLCLVARELQIWL